MGSFKKINKVFVITKVLFIIELIVCFSVMVLAMRKLSDDDWAKALAYFITCIACFSAISFVTVLSGRIVIKSFAGDRRVVTLDVGLRDINTAESFWCSMNTEVMYWHKQPRMSISTMSFHRIDALDFKRCNEIAKETDEILYKKFGSPDLPRYRALYSYYVWYADIHIFVVGDSVSNEEAEHFVCNFDFQDSMNGKFTAVYFEKDKKLIIKSIDCKNKDTLEGHDCYKLFLKKISDVFDISYKELSNIF